MTPYTDAISPRRVTFDDLQLGSVKKEPVENKEQQKKPSPLALYSAFLIDLQQSPVHPFFAQSIQIIQTKDAFMRVFKAASDDYRKQIANGFFFRANTFDKVFDCMQAGATADSTRPLNYILFCADLDALKIIDRYLTLEDYQRLGPYQSTCIHCLISGIEHGSSCHQVVECVQFLLKKDPKLATKENGIGTTPLAYAKYVYDNLSRQKIIGGGSRELAADQYNQMMCARLEELMKLLS